MSHDTDDYTPARYRVTLEEATVRRIAGCLWELHERTGHPSAAEVGEMLWPLVTQTPDRDEPVR